MKPKEISRRELVMDWPTAIVIVAAIIAVTAIVTAYLSRSK